MADRYIALLRGINVGKAKRIAMADLRALVASLGHGDVKTLLNSGNVVFSSARTKPAAAAAGIEAAIAATAGVKCRVTVLSARELAIAIAENPLLAIAPDHSRLLVSVLADPADLHKLTSLTKQDWSPEALALGKRVAYLWCPDGVLESKLAAAANRLLGDAVTARNWATLTKLHAMAQTGG